MGERITRDLQSIDAHVGGRLRALREERGLSQQSLGDRVDISFQQIQKYENGKNRIGASRLFELSQIFGVSLETFFEGLPSRVTQPEADGAFADLAGLVLFATSREGRELIEAFGSIKNRAARRQILQVIRMLGDGSPR